MSKKGSIFWLSKAIKAICTHQVVAFFEQAQANNWQGIDYSYSQKSEAGHHRIEHRQVWVVDLDQLPELSEAKKWQGLTSVVMVKRERQLWNKRTTQMCFYITSLKPDAVVSAQVIRAHWEVENSLHWVLDVTFEEDSSQIRRLNIVDVIRYKAKNWNQTNYYSLNYTRLREWAEAKSIEISEMCNSSPQDKENQTLEMLNSKVSLYEPKITTKKETTKQESDRHSNKLESIAAASPKKTLEREKSQRGSNPHSAGLNTSIGQIKRESEAKQLHTSKERNVGKVDYILNPK